MKLKETIRDKLEQFMDTTLAISGSTDDVDVIEKDQTKLLDDTTDAILAEVRKIVPEERITNITKCSQHKPEDLLQQVDNVAFNSFGEGYNRAIADLLARIS